jgi:hypothetical protein
MWGESSKNRKKCGKTVKKQYRNPLKTKFSGNNDENGALVGGAVENCAWSLRD